MPTIRQLIRKNRKPLKSKDKTPALGFGFNPIKNKPKDYNSSFKKRNSRLY